MAAANINILAVDDKAANLVALEAVLASEYNVILANSGAEAIDILKDRKDIHVILMDIQMPVMNGYDAAAQIKKLEGYEDVPIVFITAIYKEEPFVRRGYEAGGVDYFSKPFDPEILKMKIAIYASFRQKADVLKERERQIRESEELIKLGRRLTSTLEGLPVGVLVSDVHGHIVQTNREISQIFKFNESIEHDSYGKVLEWWDSYGKLLKDKGSPLERALHQGEAAHNHFINIKCIDGTPKTILTSVSPLRGTDKIIKGAVIVIQDASEPKKIEEDLEQRINNLISLGTELK